MEKEEKQEVLIGNIATHQSIHLGERVVAQVHLMSESIRILLSLKFHPQMVIGIQHLQTPISSLEAPKKHFQKAQTIQLVKKLTCAETLKEACAHA
jgi:hypothetical protein